MNQDSRVAFVTGSARGIGLAVAEEFLGHGCRVAIADKDVEEAEGVGSTTRCDRRAGACARARRDAVDVRRSGDRSDHRQVRATRRACQQRRHDQPRAVGEHQRRIVVGAAGRPPGRYLPLLSRRLSRADGMSLGRDRQHLVDCGQGRHPETTVVQRCQGRNRGSDACPCRRVGRRRNPYQRGRSGVHDDQEDGGDDRLGVARRVASDETDPTPTLCPPRGDRTGRLFPRIPGVELRDGPNLVRRRRRGREQPLVGARPVEPP